MDKTEIKTIIERQVRQQRWNETPARLRGIYDSFSDDMGHSCTSAGIRHHSQVNTSLTLLVLLLMLTAPFSLKSLTRDYPCRFIAQNKVELSVGVIESLDMFFCKQ